MSLLKSGRPSVNKNKAFDLLQKEEIVKININVKKNFHKDIKRYALEHEMTITQLIHISLQEYISKNT